MSERFDAEALRNALNGGVECPHDYDQHALDCGTCVKEALRTAYQLGLEESRGEVERLRVALQQIANLSEARAILADALDIAETALAVPGGGLGQYLTPRTPEQRAVFVGWANGLLEEAHAAGRREGIEEAARIACADCGRGVPFAGSVNGREMHVGSCGDDALPCKCAPDKCMSQEIRALLGGEK